MESDSDCSEKKYCNCEISRSNSNKRRDRNTSKSRRRRCTCFGSNGCKITAGGYGVTNCNKNKCHHNKCYRDKRHYKVIPHLKIDNLKPLGIASSIGSSEDYFKNLYIDNIYTGSINDKDGNRFDGKDGKDGIDGKNGKDGVDGKDGKDGVDGRDGKDGDSFFRYNSNNSLVVEKLRDVPSNKLSGMFFDKESGEISYDSSVIPYTDLIKLVEDMQKEIMNLKSII